MYYYVYVLQSLNEMSQSDYLIGEGGEKMKKMAFLLPLAGLVFVSTVWAYSGTHNFLQMSVTTSDGHSYLSEYNSSGSFPFNGQGGYDRSKVNLKGVVFVSLADGVPVSESFCATLKGTLKTNDGRLTATRYADTSCTAAYERKTYTVSQYQEDGTGNFSVVARDEAGVIYSASGIHRFSK